MIWQVPKMWEGGDVWILGGGPSVTKQFDIPEHVVQDVIQGKLPPSVYSPYLSSIHNKHVIGINVAYMIGNWIDIVFFGDSGFYKNHKEGLAAFPGLKVSCHTCVEKVSWVKYLSKDGRRSEGISSNPRCIGWNLNSGGAAISVAANAGAKRIILVGFDMNTNEKGMRHWHNLYKRPPEGKPLPAGRVAPLPFSLYLRGFHAIARDAKARGIEILNASPDSKITVFPKYTVKELLYDNS